MTVRGEERLVRSHSEFHFDAHGAPERIVGVVQDVTDWERSREG